MRSPPRCVDSPRGSAYNARLRQSACTHPCPAGPSLRGNPVVSQKDVILTADGLKKLQDEIDYLSTTKREEVAQRIKEAREFGDITENSEYDDAKNEQAMLEHRISQLEEKLRRARVVKTSEISTDRVQLGVTVTLKDLEDEEVCSYQLVGSAEADPIAGRVSNESPLGQSIMGRRTGDVVMVPAPGGQRRFEILDIGLA